jgi:cyanophycinase
MIQPHATPPRAPRTPQPMVPALLALAWGLLGGAVLSPDLTAQPTNSSPCPPLPDGVVHAEVRGIEPRVATSVEPPALAQAQAPPRRQIVLMGGSSEVDAASRRFVAGAGAGGTDAGDVLVVRASGSATSYNGYFQRMADADAPLRSAGTLLIEDAAMSAHPAVLCRIAEAEALWLAGGNQWNYLGHWAPALQVAIGAVGRRGSIGGTSAGAAVLGEFAFDAGEGGVTSAEALADPHGPRVRVVRSGMGQPELARVVVDQHFRERDREGRLLVFLARMQAELIGGEVYGIGLDERAALVIENGTFEVFAQDGRAVSFYRLSSPTPTSPGVPFSAPLIERVMLWDGARGAWPFNFDAYPRDALAVEEGVVRVRTLFPHGPNDP